VARMLSLDRVLGGLRSIDWRGLGVEWVVLHGSLAKRGVGRDVDLLIHRASVGGEAVLELSVKVADSLGVDPDQVDVTEAREAPCALLREAWRSGIPVYEARPGAAREWLLVRVEVCNDYELSRRKLGVVEEAARAARRRWG